MYAHAIVVPHASGDKTLTEFHVWTTYTDVKDVRRSTRLVRFHSWRRANEVINAINSPVTSGNPKAVFAAMEARGPRCDHCGHWTFRPEYLRLPRFVARLCPDCLPISPEFRAAIPTALILTQVFKSDIENSGWPIKLGGEKS